MSKTKRSLYFTKTFFFSSLLYLSVILGTYLTEASHIVLAVGSDDSAYDGQGAFIINDPYGEFTHNGYIHTPTAGNETLYSYSLIAQVGAPEGDGNYWLHLPK